MDLLQFLLRNAEKTSLLLISARAICKLCIYFRKLVLYNLAQVPEHDNCRCKSSQTFSITETFQVVFFVRKPLNHAVYSNPFAFPDDAKILFRHTNCSAKDSYNFSSWWAFFLFWPSHGLLDCYTMPEHPPKQSRYYKNGGNRQCLLVSTLFSLLQQLKFNHEHINRKLRDIGAKRITVTTSCRYWPYYAPPL